MCGISGIWNFDGAPVEQSAVLTMQDTLRHRGPDGEGTYVKENVGLGHRRLSIIDIAGGKQPISNEDGSVWIVYNGEIYNFLELRAELEAKGHSFRTASDTEVIVHLYEELGPKCVQRLMGMFAFGLWDSKKQLMLLARDRLGLKPLYYLLDDARVLFASELKGIMAARGVDRTLDLEALDAYLTLDHIPSPRTIYRNVKKLPPAHILVLERGRSRIERYWQLDMATLQDNAPSRSADEWSEGLEFLLRQSVRRRLLGDVPIGLLLSGGVDSSAVAALMAQESEQPVKSFSIGTTADDFNELPYARMVAQRLGTEHHEFIVEPDAVGILPGLVAAYDEPFADSSAVPTYYVAKMASQHVKVCLAGDGGDELFAGYPWYQSLSLEPRFGGVPRRLRQPLLGSLRKIWPEEWRGADRLFDLTRRDRAERYAATKRRFSVRERSRILTPSLRQAFGGLDESGGLLAFAREAASLDNVSAMQYTDLMSYLPEDLLVKVDRASMLHGLEVRLPLLDHEFVEFAATVPSHLKLNNGESKHILKRLISRWVPREAIYREKKGFGIPLEHWFRGELLPFTQEILLDDRTRRRGFLQVDSVATLLEKHRSGQTNPLVTTHQIWNMLVLEIWCRRFLDQPASPGSGS